MKKVDFENLLFKFGMKVIYKGQERDIMSVYFEDYKIGIHDINCVNQERIVNCKDVEVTT